MNVETQASKNLCLLSASLLDPGFWKQLFIKLLRTIHLPVHPPTDHPFPMGPAEWSKAQSQNEEVLFSAASTSTIVVKTYFSQTWLRAYLLGIPILSADPVRIPEQTYVCE
ncbi:hypothetical protein ILYODFUR_037629 [Ilyodon furcidens]|uniref:Uncharacterized protein n=1 Tax=Ilyodon furcidens TaxID=33524 RepID=A0ABV0U2B0_9TELE